MSCRIVSLSLIIRCTKFASLYACIYMAIVEQGFLEIQELQLLLRYIDNFLFICTYGKEELKTIMEKLNNFTTNLKFMYESCEKCKIIKKFNSPTLNLKFMYEFRAKSISFLDPIITLSEQKLQTTIHIKSTEPHQYLHYASSHL